MNEAGYKQEHFLTRKLQLLKTNLNLTWDCRLHGTLHRMTPIYQRHKPTSPGKTSAGYTIPNRNLKFKTRFETEFGIPQSRRLPALGEDLWAASTARPQAIDQTPSKWTLQLPKNKLLKQAQNPHTKTSMTATPNLPPLTLQPISRWQPEIRQGERTVLEVSIILTSA